MRHFYTCFLTQVVQAPKTCHFFFNYCISSSIVHTFFIENDAEISPAHYTMKVVEEGLNVAFMMNKLAVMNS